MQWWRFFFWNAAGAIVWATSVSLISYYLGDAAASAFGRYGLYAAGGAILLSAIGFLIVKRIEKRVVDEDSSAEDRDSSCLTKVSYTRDRSSSASGGRTVSQRFASAAASIRSAASSALLPVSTSSVRTRRSAPICA